MHLVTFSNLQSRTIKNETSIFYPETQAQTDLAVCAGLFERQHLFRRHVLSSQQGLDWESHMAKRTVILHTIQQLLTK